MTQNEIMLLCYKLAALLADSHPGLATWTEARNRVALELRDALNEVLA